MMIIFKETERLVRELDLGGYRAQTVTYTLAKLANVSQGLLPLDHVWQTQFLPAELESQIRSLAPLVATRLRTSAGQLNISEWAKKPAAWQDIVAMKWTMTTRPTGESVKTLGPPEDRPSTTASEREAFFELANLAPGIWDELMRWGAQTRYLSAEQRRTLKKVKDELNRRQWTHAKLSLDGAAVLAEARRRGFPVDGYTKVR